MPRVDALAADVRLAAVRQVGEAQRAVRHRRAGYRGCYQPVIGARTRNVGHFSDTGVRKVADDGRALRRTCRPSCRRCRARSPGRMPRRSRRRFRRPGRRRASGGGDGGDPLRVPVDRASPVDRDRRASSGRRGLRASRVLPAGPSSAGTAARRRRSPSSRRQRSWRWRRPSSSTRRVGRRGAADRRRRCRGAVSGVASVRRWRRSCPRWRCPPGRVADPSVRRRHAVPAAGLARSPVVHGPALVLVLLVGGGAGSARNCCRDVVVRQGRGRVVVGHRGRRRRTVGRGRRLGQSGAGAPQREPGEQQDSGGGAAHRGCACRGVLASLLHGSPSNVAVL